VSRRAKVTPDRYAKLAGCMGVSPEEVPRLIQEHAPWNGHEVCDAVIREREAVIYLFRSLGLSLMAQAVENGKHLTMYEKHLKGVSPDPAPAYSTKEDKP